MHVNLKIGRGGGVLVLVLLSLWANSAGGATGTVAEKPAPLPPLTLSLREALSAAVDNNPDVQL